MNRWHLGSSLVEDLLEAQDEGRVALTPEDRRILLLHSTDAIAGLLRDPESERAAQLVAKAEEGYTRVLGPLPEGMKRQLAPSPASTGESSGEGARAPSRSVADASIRVPLAGLDQLGRVVTELFISRTSIEQQLLAEVYGTRACQMVVSH